MPKIQRIVLRLCFLLVAFALAELCLTSIGKIPWIPIPAEQSLDRLLEPEASLGWQLRAGEIKLKTNSGQQYTVNVLDQHTRKVQQHIAPDSEKLLILGDSSIFGWGLSDSQTVASHLAQLGSKYQIVHAAVPGYGPLQSYMFLEKLLVKNMYEQIVFGVAEYLLQRDIGALTWARILAEHANSLNVSLPYADLDNASLKIFPANKFFLDLPFRRNLATVRLIEEGITVPGSWSRSKKSTEIHRALFRELAALGAENSINITILLWQADNILKDYGALFQELGFKVANCAHPQAIQPNMLIDDHPNEEQHKYWAECLKVAMFLDNSSLP